MQKNERLEQMRVRMLFPFHLCCSCRQEDAPSKADLISRGL